MPTVEPTHAASILSPASGYIGGYDYTLTPYVGCTFGCDYCYVPTIIYHRHLAPTWGATLKPKENAPELLLKAAKAGKVAGSRIYYSPNTDPYLPQERTWRITRRLLEIFCDYPPALLVIQTRSPLVTRDLDLLRQLGSRLVVAVSITTDREDIRQMFERTCPPIGKRIAALTTIHAAGIRTQASVAPLLPCNPLVLADLIDEHSNWVVVQALKLGQGARTRKQAIDTVRQRGWDGWLQGGSEVREAMYALRQRFGPRYHEAAEGFNLGWLQVVAP